MVITPATPRSSAATRTAPSPAWAAASEPSNQRRPASSASAWSRHGATPSASRGPRSRIAARSASTAGRTMYPRAPMARVCRIRRGTGSPDPDEETGKEGARGSRESVAFARSGGRPDPEVDGRRWTGGGGREEVDGRRWTGEGGREVEGEGRGRERPVGWVAADGPCAFGAGLPPRVVGRGGRSPEAGTWMRYRSSG